MTDKERITEILKAYTKKHNIMASSVILEEYAEELLANGVIVPPIEVGQTVWYVDDFTEEIEECKIYGFAVVNGKLSLLVDNGECKFVTRKWCNTKEEAEKALERSKDDE